MLLEAFLPMCLQPPVLILLRVLREGLSSIPCPLGTAVPSLFPCPFPLKPCVSRPSQLAVSSAPSALLSIPVLTELKSCSDVGPSHCHPHHFVLCGGSHSPEREQSRQTWIW